METKIITPSISTLVAELRVVKIDNKQMTQAVFNQLQEEEPFDGNYKLINQIWGKVLYRDSVWVIFSKGNELRRYEVLLRPTNYSFEKWALRYSEINNKNLLGHFKDSGIYKAGRYLKDDKTGMSTCEPNTLTRPFIDKVDAIAKSFPESDTDHINFCIKLLDNSIQTALFYGYDQYKQQQEAISALKNKLINSDQLFIAV